VGVGYDVTTASGDNAPSPLAILVHKENATDALSLDELREIMKGERKFWTGSVPIALLTREKGSEARQRILEKVYELDEKDYSRYWLKQIYRGKAVAPPKVLASEQEMIEAVAKNPSAIGYANVATAPEGLKILTLDGKRPSDKGYFFMQSE
ncbi:MAG: hypothetical protein A2Z34_06010, partial [Planctomycetes bacterium RBG_16_59_8]